MEKRGGFGLWDGCYYLWGETFLAAGLVRCEVASKLTDTLCIWVCVYIRYCMYGIVYGGMVVGTTCTIPYSSVCHLENSCQHHHVNGTGQRLRAILYGTIPVLEFEYSTQVIVQ